MEIEDTTINAEHAEHAELVLSTRRREAAM
jgi:hypothetical protein